MLKLLIYFVVFGCLGTTTEVFFTAISNNISQFRSTKNIDARLLGESYVWMFFIYGSAGILFHLFFPIIGDYPIIVRLLTYTIGIFAVEFFTGWLIEKITGACPWHYYHKWAVKGYIRLDYAPLWLGFGFVLEQVFLLLESLRFVGMS